MSETESEKSVEDVLETSQSVVSLDIDDYLGAMDWPKGPMDEGFRLADWLLRSWYDSDGFKESFLKLLPYDNDKTIKKMASLETLETLDDHQT